MQNLTDTKFILLLKTLSDEELKSFGVWLKSPWCNSNKNLTALFEIIRKDYPNFDNPKLTKEKLFRKILPKGKFSARRMNNLLSEAAQSLEKFFAFQHLQDNPQQQKDFLNQELQKRHLDDYFFKYIERDIDELEAKSVKDWEDHLQLLQWHHRIYHHPTQQPRMRPGGQTIVRMGEELDILYALERAAIINEKIARQRILKNEEHDVAMELAKWETLTEGLEHPALELYRMRFAYTEEYQLEQYLALRDLFFEVFEELNEKESQVHLFHLLNDCFKLIRTKRVKVEDSLILYKFGIKHKILFKNDKLTLSQFITIVAVSNFKGEIDYSKKFITEYLTSLDEHLQIDAKVWSKAHLLYWTNDLDISLQSIINHNFTIPVLNQISKTLITQLYFDLYLVDSSYESLLFNYLDAFEKWIVREKSRSLTLKKSFLRFIQITRLLAKYHTDPNIPVDKVTSILENEKNIQAGEWLRDKQNKIMKMKSRNI